jgi:ribosomal protein S18 acetylase RimI-like enzyme
VDVKEMVPGHVDALCAFFADVPADDRTFFKEDIGDAREVARRWVEDRRSVRRLAFDEGGGVAAFAALSPGVERTSHVADLRLVIAPRARGRGLGRALARAMLAEAFRHGFRKVTVDIAADQEGAIGMFRALGFQPEALLRDQLCDPDGGLHDIVVLAHAVDEHWSGLLGAGIDDAVA